MPSLRILLISVLLFLAACATPPRPAMVPLGSSGDFGYAERDLGPDRIEVTYRGAAVPVSPYRPREDGRAKAELDLAHDLALWRAAQVAVDRGRAALKIEFESRDSDVVVQQRVYYRPDPFYDPFFDPYDDPFWPMNCRYCGPGPLYHFDHVRTATARAEVRLTVTLSQSFDPTVEGMLSAAETLARLKAARSGAVY